MKSEHTSVSEEETRKIAFEFAKSLKPGAVISLRGSLGAGKTVFAKGIAEYLGITEAIVSPTFTLLQEYEGKLPMYHMDLYRLGDASEFEMIGGEELLYSKGITLIEWSEKIQSMLPKNTYYVVIEIGPDQKRTIRIEAKE